MRVRQSEAAASRDIGDAEMVDADEGDDDGDSDDDGTIDLNDVFASSGTPTKPPPAPT